MSKFSLKQAQVDFIGSPEQFPAYIAGVGTGKSTALIAKALLHSQESKDNLGVIVRKQFSDLRNSTIKDFQDYTGLKVNESTHEVRLKNGSTILFIHGDVLDSLKNINCGWFGIEQAEEFPDDTAWQFLKMRLRRKVLFRSGFLIGNTNGHNWIYDIYKRQSPPPNHELIEATTYDFKDIHAPDYITNLETLPKKLYNRYVMNSWEEAEGLVFDEYLESRDTIEPFSIPDGWEKGFCLDHGFRNPTAVLWYAIDFDGTIFIYDEHYEAGQPISYHAQKIKPRGIYSGIADPSIFNKTMSRENFMYSIADEYQEQGINLRAAVKSKEDASIARVNEFFKSGRIKIFKNCVNTITEIGNWKWKEVRPGLNAKEEPQDLANHACDDIKYIVASRFGSAIHKQPGMTDNMVGRILEKLQKENQPVSHRFEGSRYRA